MVENIPSGLLYTPTHEWVKIEGNTITVGITDHAQSELTDIVYVQLPKTGMNAAGGKVIAVLESVKTVADIYAPATGVVKSVNEALVKNPELLNKDPYGKGWVFVMEVAAPPQDLLTPEKYKVRLTTK